MNPYQSKVRLKNLKITKC